MKHDETFGKHRERNQLKESTTPPKIHILLDHLEDYFNQTEVTLLKTMDELCEHMHQLLHKQQIRSFYAVKDISNTSQGHQLFQAVRH